MDLVCDVLDKPILDARDQRMGRVDGILAEILEGQPPRLLYLEVSGSTLAHRIHPRLGHWVKRLARRFSPTRGRPCRIPWARIREIGDSIHVDVVGDTTPALAWERWLRTRVIGRIPGA
jgi:sporulation protein YlmC with PRC-barrel domain